MIDVVEAHKGADIVLLDLRGISPLTDFFVIATGESERQLRALLRAVEEQLSRVGVEPHHIEGTPESGWILMDYLDVIIHLFSPVVRQFYRLEEMWEDAPIVLHIQ
ncbi:MAG: ribosome silencing factor [Ardenticatenia bacterium]|nr:ribosome silencing factor [Ardenticatenia bacterium]